MNTTKERKVLCLFLDKGMYVSRLDRPWQDTPFWMQGFFIKTDLELETLRKYCDYVYIDADNGASPEFYLDEKMQLPSNQYLEKFFSDQQKLNPPNNQKSLKQALDTAQVILESTADKFKTNLDNIKNNQTFDFKVISTFVDAMYKSIQQNADAFLLLCRLRNKDEYTHLHSIDACALAINFGIRLGLEESDIFDLAISALLLDIGKAKIADELLNKSDQLTEEEFRVIKKHVEFGILTLKDNKHLNNNIFNAILTHHERFDGSGYPNNLIGKQTPVYGRILAIIDCFDAMSSQKPYGKPELASQVLQYIYQWRDKYFQREIVEKFMQCIGSFPNGCFVELNTGEVGLVISQNTDFQLKPVVMLMLDEKKQNYDEYKVVNLVKDKNIETGKIYAILREIEPRSFGIDLFGLYRNLSSLIPDMGFVEDEGGFISRFVSWFKF